VQPATVYPWLTYDDARAAIDFLQAAFGAPDPEGDVWHFGTYQPLEGR
jgi:uncharacterized glyoxalase superfamily protein PhnB